MRTASLTKVLGALGVLGGIAILGATVMASDHSEAPGAAADQPADIADLYAWHEGDKLNVALTYAGAKMPAANQTGSYDADVLYTIHIDTTDDGVSETDILVRFGKNDAGDWGVEVQNLPGASGTVVGPVGEVVTDSTSGLRVFSGLRDDPFFFDLQGFAETVDTGALAFASLAPNGTARDSLAGTNASAIVLEMDLAAAQGTGSKLRVWATTGRK